MLRKTQFGKKPHLDFDKPPFVRMRDGRQGFGKKNTTWACR